MALSRLVLCLTACTAFLLSTGPCSGQAVPTARRSNSIALYAGGQAVSTDYNSTDKGFLIGGDFTHHFLHLDGSLDLRFNKATGDVIGEKSFVGGFKLSKGFGRFHPYGSFLYGYGVVTFDTPQKKADGSLVSYDDSIVKDLGLGVDVQLTRLFGLKVDGQYQFWNLGVNQPLTPSIASIGVVFYVPYRTLRPRSR